MEYYSEPFNLAQLINKTVDGQVKLIKINKVLKICNNMLGPLTVYNYEILAK